MSAHSRSASPREKGLVASPTYRLDAVVVPWTTIGALATAAIQPQTREEQIVGAVQVATVDGRVRRHR